MSISLSVKLNRNLITPALRKISAKLQALPQETYNKFVSETPIDTGNARKKTRLVSNKRINAQYAYAGVLDKGRHMTNRGMRGSKQSPRGMTKPTKEWMKQRIRKILRSR